MSASVGTMRGGSNRHSGTKEKTLKGEKGTGSKQKSSQSTLKSESQSSKMHPTQEQIILAQRLNTNHSDADPKTKKLVDELMELTGKSEDVVVIALHDAENDADRAVNMLLEGDNEQRGEWREQGGKRKKKATNQKDGSNQGNEDNEGRGNKDRGDKEDKDQEGVVERFDAPPRRGRQNGGPPPRLARGRGRDRGNFGDRDRNNAEDWDIDKGEDRRERSGSDRGRPRGRGFGGKRGGGGRGRFNNSSDRDNRSFNRVPRFEKANHSQPLEGPEIDTWTNETAETNTNKDTDWDNWNDTWVNEEDQWTGTLEETKVFTPSQMKIPEPDPVISEPPSSLGQRLDVGSLFIESAKYSKAPDYTKPSSDAYITQFNQAATESIKNTIGIGSASRAPASSLTIPQQSSSNTLGLSSLTQSSGHVQSSVLGNLAQGSQSSMSQTMTQLSQITQSSNQAIGLGSQQSSRDQAPPAQSRIQSVMQQQQQQQNIPTSLSASLQQRPKPPRSKLPPPSKIPSSAVEMPGHIPRNPQLDLQFGIDFTSDSGTSFSFGAGDDGEVPSSYPTSTSNGSQSVISNHLSQAHVAKSNDSNSMVLNMKTSPSAGSNKVLTSMEAQQSNRTTTVYHNSVYTSSPPKNENQSLERDQNKLEHKSSPMMSQRSGSTLSQSKESSSNYPTANGYAPSYQTHQKASSISQTQTYTHTTNSQPPQSTNFSGQYPASQSYPSNLSAPPSATQYPPGQPPQFNNAQNQYSSGQGQFASAGSSNHTSIPHANHQSQYSGTQNSYSSGGQSQYSSYPNNSSFPTQPNYPSTNQSGGSNSTLYPVTTQSGGSSYNSQSNSYQSPSAGSYHTRDSQQNASVTTQSNTGVTYPTASQSVSLKPASSQTNTNYNSQNFAPAPVTLQTSSLTNKLEQNLSKITLKDTASLDGHPSAQYDHSNTSTTVSTSLSLPSSTSSASLSTGKAPPNLPPGVPLMGQYIMGQSTMPPYFTVPPLYGFEPDMLLQQRMPMQTGSYYDIGAFPAPAGSALPTGRDQQQPLTTVSFSGTSADSSKMTRVDAQSPNSTSQPQNAQQIPINFHYGYYYPSMFPGATSIQYPPVFPVTPVTNTAAHTGATANPQFQKTFASVYAPKGYDELNQAQDFSKTGYGSSSSTGKSSGTRSGTSDITPNAYNKTHSQAFDKQGFHGGTPPPFNLPLATATQAGPMAAPTTPYGAPFVPVMAAHQPHSQMMHHPIQQDSNSSTSRGLNQQGNQSKSGGAKGYGAPQYWNN
ncbi:protein lingerer isoform X2 [Biomphalaria glabrata]|uniref:Protein lingerer isoform X2 n=1 Tax=Biomphalaria glabrata TaxID=6526 RepID=A0A9W2YZK8_BIOGL|nr:protein lingerer isoform X2 [Biomphalaria glabrata]